MSRGDWKICDISKHGMNWKRLYIEKYIQLCIQNYYVSIEEQNYKSLIALIDAGKYFIYTLIIDGLISHLDLSDLLIDFMNLNCLDVKFG
jgi:hypothetical protein